MRTIKKVASHIFIDGFGGMTQGLFATLIIGTMIQQIGLLIGGSTGNVIYLLGKALQNVFYCFLRSLCDIRNIFNNR